MTVRASTPCIYVSLATTALAEKKIEPKNRVIRNDGVNPKQTFDNFVVGPSNKESHSAALGCAYRPGQFYTPLFIYGNSGLGKTHLLSAIGNYIKKLNPDAKVLYTSSSDFVRKVASTIATGDF